MGGKNQTTTSTTEPWKPAQPYLEGAMGTAEGMFNSGQFGIEPYQGNRVAGFGDTSQMSQDMMMSQAQGPQLTGDASGFLRNMMNPDYQSGRLEQVKQNALGSAVPAAVSMFSGSGMTNSSQAMDTVGRAATDAVAPYEYGAFENAQNRGMTAAGMAPTMDRAGYLPATMMGAVGASQDAMRQAGLDADMAKYYEGQQAPIDEFQRYLSSIMGLGGMGGTASQTQPGTSGMENIAAGGLSGIGTFGALSQAGITNPYLAPLSIGAGLLGMI